MLLDWGQQSVVLIVAYTCNMVCKMSFQCDPEQINRRYVQIQDESNVEITMTGKLAYKHENEGGLQDGGK